MDKQLFHRQVIARSLQDMKVELSDEFDRNFTRKAFFSKKWKDTKFPNKKGSLLMRSGALRGSIRSRISTGAIEFTSNLPYAAIHNNGGEITVTKKMRGYFFYKLKETRKKYGYKKDGSKRNNAYNERLSDEEQFYRAMAGKKVGSKIIIPQRQFIGQSPETDRIIEDIVKENINDFFKNNPIIKKT